MAPISHPLIITQWFITILSLHAAITKETAPKDIYRYFADTSGWQFRQFACTEQESECLKEKKMLFEEDGKCYAVGDQGPCATGETFHVDKEEAMRLGGHLRGTCENLCPGVDHAPLAATGECMAWSDVQSKICRTDWYLQPALDMFGQWVCKWTRLVCSPPKQSHCGGNIWSPYNGICSLPDIYTTSYDKVPADSPADHPLHRYFSKHSVLNCEFPCTKSEEACLRYGRVLSSDGNCYPLFSFFSPSSPNANEDKKLQLTCNRSCVSFEESQIETETCVNYSSITLQVCRSEWGMLITNDVFGARTCECLGTRQASLTPPASAPGYCRTPDFKNPVQSPSYDRTLALGLKLPCSEEEYACLQKGQVLFDGACHALRMRGPCAENEQLVLDKETLRHARLQPKCQGPCPGGSVYVPIDGYCFTYAEVISLMCPKNMIALDEFGGWNAAGITIRQVLSTTPLAIRLVERASYPRMRMLAAAVAADLEVAGVLEATMVAKTPSLMSAETFWKRAKSVNL